MTVSKIRELMQERIIPESVLPQNIAAYLTDGDYIPPELDAFTFLNRLRSLGIGSADFLYLLKGCGAPEEAVDKIEQRPDMNLQSLIMTLDGSGLTSQDYTRMLYTARQLWEHTITMRLDLEEAQEQQPEEPSPQPEPTYTARQKKPAQETSEKAPAPAEQEKPARVRTARQKKKEEPEFREYVGVKPIGQHNQTEEPLQEKDPAAGSDKTGTFTAVRLKPRPDKQADEDEQGQYEAAEEASVSRRGGIITAAAGAAVLCALSAAMELLGFAAPENGLAAVHYAESNSEIFAEIRSAYNSSGKIGSENVQTLPGREQVFGDLLIDPGEQLGSFTSGATLWAVESEQITVYSLDGDEAVVTVEIAPPEGSQFITVYQTENGIAAVFSSDQSCGIAGIDGSGQSYISEQSGALTDYYFDGDIIRLGSVYTPQYTRSFSADDTAEYLPSVGWNGSATLLDPADIAVNGAAQGCSYAVWGEYSAANGQPAGLKAALGDPVYSGAERFTAVLRQESGALLISTDGQGALNSVEIGEISAAAYGGGITATAEQTENGVAVYLRDEELNTVSGFSTGSGITGLRIYNGIIYVRDGDKTVMAADISSAASPAPLELTAASGRISGEFALCTAKTSSGITITLYKLTDGKAVQTDSYAKSLTAKELESLQFCGANTMVINGQELCGASYRWFDGVSVVDEFAQLGKSRSLKTLYDDRSGFTAAAAVEGKLALICGEKIFQ